MGCVGIALLQQWLMSYGCGGEDPEEGGGELFEGVGLVLDPAQAEDASGEVIENGGVAGIVGFLKFSYF